MKNSFSLLAVLAAFLIACHPVFCRELRAPHSANPGTALHPTPEHGCPPVHILVDFLAGGNGLIMWDPVPGVDKYVVQLTDSGNNLLLDTVTTETYVFASGMIPEKNYTVSVCYRCPQSGESICANRTFRYIIIEDQVVMLQSSFGCHCKKLVETEGVCNGTEATLYTLATPRIYNISLLDGTQISFVSKFHVNPVGDCPTDFINLGEGIHGAYEVELPYYSVGNSKIFFHGTTFCIQGAPVQSVTYCDVDLPIKDKNDDGQRSAADAVFPNPFQEKIMVEVPATGYCSRLELFDVVGLKMLESTACNPGVIQFNTTALTPGWYYLRCSGTGQKSAGKWLFKP